MPESDDLEVRRKRIALSINRVTEDRLNRLAQFQGDRPATIAYQLLATALQELDENGDIPENDDPVTLERSDLHQIKEFIRLLLGTRISRQGVSFSLVGHILGIKTEELSQLYEKVSRCNELMREIK